MLHRCQRLVNIQAVLPREISNDGVAVADRFLVIGHVGKLPARRGFCIDDMPMLKPQTAELEEREYLQTIRIVVFEALQPRVRKECYHAWLPEKRAAWGSSA